MADFYKFQRKRLDLLMDGDQPLGGKWSYDEDNRKKIPKNLHSEIPKLFTFRRSATEQEAVEYVNSNYSSNLGKLEDLSLIHI